MGEGGQLGPPRFDSCSETVWMKPHHHSGIEMCIIFTSYLSLGWCFVESSEVWPLHRTWELNFNPLVRASNLTLMQEESVSNSARAAHHDSQLCQNCTWQSTSLGCTYAQLRTPLQSCC